jgi:hypothetical protein
MSCRLLAASVAAPCGLPAHAAWPPPVPTTAAIQVGAIWSGRPWHVYATSGACDCGLWAGAVAGDLPISRRQWPWAAVTVDTVTTED